MVDFEIVFWFFVCFAVSVVSLCGANPIELQLTKKNNEIMVKVLFTGFIVLNLFCLHITQLL